MSHQPVIDIHAIPFNDTGCPTMLRMDRGTENGLLEQHRWLTACMMKIAWQENEVQSTGHLLTL